MQINQCSNVPVANLARTSYAYVHPFPFSPPPHFLQFPSPSLSYSFVTICDYLFVQLLHVLPVSCVHLSHFVLSFQIWGKPNLWHCPQSSCGQRGTAGMSAYTSLFKVYCLACHILWLGMSSLCGLCMVSEGDILILWISKQLLESLPLQRLPAPAACSRQKSSYNCLPISFSYPSLIPGGDDDMDFDIEKSTGSMVIARALDARKKSSYNLTVEVTDGSTTIKTQVMSSSLVETPSRVSICQRESFF